MRPSVTAPVAVPRRGRSGLVLAVRWWRRWVRVRDYREAAEESEKLADKFTEIRALTLFRWKVTGAVAVVASGSRSWPLVYGAVAVDRSPACCAVALAIRVGARTAARGGSRRWPVRGR